MAEGAECIPGTEPGGTRDPGIYDKKHQVGRLFADMQAAKELEKRRKTPEEKGANSTTVLKDENLLLNEQVRKLSEKPQSLTTSLHARGAASSAGSSAEWQRFSGRTQR